MVACGEIANGFEGPTGRELKCSCGELAKDCPVWGVFARGSNASLNHDALVLTLLEHVNGKYAILINSSKTAWGLITAPFRLRRLLGQRFFLLHLVRDPRAVCWSAIRLPLIKTRRKQKPTPIEQALSRPIPRCFRTAAGWWVANLSLRARLAGSTLVDICASSMRTSHPPHARRCGALFEAVSPDLPMRLAEPEAGGNRHQIYGNRMRRQRLAFCRRAARRRLAIRNGAPLPPVGRRPLMAVAVEIRLLTQKSQRSMLTPTLKTSGVTPSGTRRQSARCSANESQTFLKESIHENDS